MGTAINLNAHNVHELEFDSRRLLFHIPSSALFEPDELVSGLISHVRETGATEAATLEAHFAPTYGEARVREAIRELQELDVLSGDRSVALFEPNKRVESIPLNTVVLNINTGCNLSCTYCYKEDLSTPANGQKMDFAVGAASIDMLLRDAPEQARYNVVFFGGEPLTNLALIKQLIAYAEDRVGQLGKKVDFSLTTNATLLNEATIDYLNEHRVGIAISIDGPQAIHDKNRITVGGQGTYATVERKTRLLMSRYNARPVGARVTLTRGTTDLIAIWDHLFNTLGFAEVGFAPVTAGDIDDFNLEDHELVAVFDQMKALGDRYLEAALENRSIGFSNLHQLLTDIHLGTKKSLPCGAGYSMLAVDKAGDLNLCHRFTGSDLPTFGNVKDGVEMGSIADFLGKRLDREHTGCNTCRIRNLCSGGCYHESYQRYNDPAHPVYHYCDLMRDWVDHGLKIYAQILDKNPQFFDIYLSPRRPAQ